MFPFLKAEILSDRRAFFCPSKDLIKNTSRMKCLMGILQTEMTPNTFDERKPKHVEDITVQIRPELFLFAVEYLIL